METKLTLPKLDYAYTDLEPILSENLLTIHHTKHHQNYIDTYNRLLGEFEEAKTKGDINKIVSLTPGLKFNLGSHINHSIYWKNLAPTKNGGGQPPQDSKLVQMINHSWGSLDNFINDFINNLMKIQGSGWGNLAYNIKSKSLEYIETKDQDPIALNSDKVAILCIDAWEHSWYLKYLNEKKKYYTEIWKIINWKDLEERYLNAFKLSFTN